MRRLLHRLLRLARGSLGAGCSSGRNELLSLRQAHVRGGGASPGLACPRARPVGAALGVGQGAAGGGGLAKEALLQLRQHLERVAPYRVSSVQRGAA